MTSARSCVGANVGIVLGGDHDGGDPLGHAALVFHGDLGLAIGSQVVQLAALANLGEASRHAVRQRDGQRHQLGGLAAREPEHHALVPGAQLILVDTLGDIGDCSLTDTRVPQVR